MTFRIYLLDNIFFTIHVILLARLSYYLAIVSMSIFAAVCYGVTTRPLRLSIPIWDLWLCSLNFFFSIFFYQIYYSGCCFGILILVYPCCPLRFLFWVLHTILGRFASTYELDKFHVSSNLIWQPLGIGAASSFLPHDPSVILVNEVILL